MKKYLIKYVLEFFVIVTGISLSFWINEWDNKRINSVDILIVNSLATKKLLTKGEICFKSSDCKSSNCNFDDRNYNKINE